MESNIPLPVEEDVPFAFVAGVPEEEEEEDAPPVESAPAAP